MRNLTNPEVIEPFLKRLTARYPELETYIKTKVRSHLLKRENTFVTIDEKIGLSLFFKNISGKVSPEEKAMYRNYGVKGQYLNLNLSEDAFDDYCHWLDYAQNLSPETLLIMGFKELKQEAKKVLAEAKRTTKITRPVAYEGTDYVLVNSIGEDKLYELVTLQAYKEEGFLMKHCVGQFVQPSKSHKVYSLRNHEGLPIMTLRTNAKTNKLIEAKGKFNSAPNKEKLGLVLDHMGFTQRTIAEKKKSLLKVIFSDLVFHMGMSTLSMWALSKGDNNPVATYLVTGMWLAFGVLFLCLNMSTYFSLRKQEQS